MLQDTPTPRDPNGRFAAGNPGRPKGAVNRMSARVAHAIFKDFEANHTDVLAYLRVHHMTTYALLLGRILAKAPFAEDEVVEPLVADPLEELIAKGMRAVKVTPGGEREARLAAYEASVTSVARGGPAYAQALAAQVETAIEEDRARRQALDNWQDDEDEDDDDEPAAPPETPDQTLTRLSDGEIRSIAQLDALVARIRQEDAAARAAASTATVAATVAAPVADAQEAAPETQEAQKPPPPLENTVEIPAELSVLSPEERAFRGPLTSFYPTGGG